jgi:hypothetical protein
MMETLSELEWLRRYVQCIDMAWQNIVAARDMSAAAAKEAMSIDGHLVSISAGHRHRFRILGAKLESDLETLRAKLRMAEPAEPGSLPQ